MLLYKYCSPRGLAILETGSIHLTRPSTFNDPFDVKPYIAKFTDVVRMGAHLQAKMKDIVVLSLAENRDSLLMWAHYARQHEGFLIGFAFEDEILARPTPLFSHFGAVSYCHHRPAGESFMDVPDHELYFRKSSEWAYEREWRLIETLLSIDGDPEDPKPRWPFELITQNIHSIVVGHRAGALFPKLHQLLLEPRYEHVDLQIAAPDISSFRLNLVEWPRAYWDQGPPYPLETVVE
jgi:hypothetical protein